MSSHAFYFGLTVDFFDDKLWRLVGIEPLTLGVASRHANHQTTRTPLLGKGNVMADSKRGKVTFVMVPIPLPMTSLSKQFYVYVIRDLFFG